jgi:integrative and conjugative element protein (TIGR02256 family)
LEGNLGSFWSGGSCRDISVVLPYTRVLAHAGLLGEQVQNATARSEATLRVWSRDPESGAVTLHEVPAATERAIPIQGLTVFIDAGLEAKLHQLRREGLPTETGGILLGYHDLNVNALVLVDALPAPSDSDASPEFFERGVEGLAVAVGEAARRTAGVVGYVGEWHSHPDGYPPAPSGRDLYQLVYLALRMADDGLPAVSAIVSEKEVRVMGGLISSSAVRPVVVGHHAESHGTTMDGARRPWR